MERTKVSHYQLLRKIGEGGMGEVYLAQDTILGRRVAVKFLSAKLTGDERSKKRLLREARAAAKLDHANICAIYEVGEVDGNSFIAMQYIEGESLGSKTRLKRLDAHESVDIAIQITDALVDAHSHGLVHRDIKPENVIISPRGQVKVLDFGLAKNVKDNSGQPDAQTLSLLSESGALIGTVPYMSPEQVRAEDLDGRSDIFSIGTVLYEMLSGKQPFNTGNSALSIAAVLGTEPKRLRDCAPGVPAELERIVRKCLEKDKERRYQSARDLLVDLKELEREIRPASTMRGSSKASIATQIRWAGKRGWRWPIALLLIAVVFLTAAAMYRFLHVIPGGERVEPVKAITSIAILPFANESANSEIEYLCDGLTESLISSLSQLPNMKVIARSSVFHYKGREILPQEIGRELRVQALLVGRVVQRGAEFFINLELVDVGDNTRLWAAEYNRKLLDLLPTQGEMSKSLQDKLRPKLSDEQRGQLAKRYTHNIEAYQLYLQGRYYWNKRTMDSLKNAADYFRQAIQKDPNYALAYVGLADSYLLGSVLPPKEVAFKATEAASRALSIDSNLAEAHASLGFAKSRYEWNWSEAQKEYQRAIELNPNYSVAYYWYADLLMALGKQQEALSVLRRAQELDPLSPTINTDLGRPLFYERQYDRAIEQFRRALELDPNFWTTHYCLGLAYLPKGMHAEAINEFQIATNLSGGSPTALGVLGYSYAVSGKKEKAKKVIADLNKLSKQRNVSSYSMAIIYVGLGDRVTAFKWLEKAFEEREPSLILLKVSPLFDSIRSDPRFLNLTNRMYFPA